VVTTIKAFVPKRGWLNSIASQTTSGSLIQNLTYSFNNTDRGNGVCPLAAFTS
jgi:hypothetical protein